MAAVQNPNSPDVPTLPAGAAHLFSHSIGSLLNIQRISSYRYGSCREALGTDLVKVAVSPLDYYRRYRSYYIYFVAEHLCQIDRPRRHRMSRRRSDLSEPLLSTYLAGASFSLTLRLPLALNSSCSLNSSLPAPPTNKALEFTRKLIRASAVTTASSLIWRIASLASSIVLVSSRVCVSKPQSFRDAIRSEFPNTAQNMAKITALAATSFGALDGMKSVNDNRKKIIARPLKPQSRIEFGSHVDVSNLRHPK